MFVRRVSLLIAVTADINLLIRRPFYQLFGQQKHIFSVNGLDSEDKQN